MNRSATSSSQAAPRTRGVSLTKRTDRNAGRGNSIARLTNTYLQDSSKLTSTLRLINFAAVATLIILIGLLANFSSTNYRVFATTAEGKLTALPPVEKDLGENTVLLWAADAISPIMTMGFHDYNIRMREIRSFFTDRGWDSYNRFLRAPIFNNMPGLRSLLENDRAVFWIRQVKPPQILRREVIGGIFTYEIRSALAINIVTSSTPQSLPLQIDITVERVPPEVSASGLAISRWRLLSR